MAWTLLGVLVLLIPATPVFAQHFLQPLLPGSALSSPERLGLSPEDGPPDLDPPEVGEDPETAPFSEDEEEEPPKKRAASPAAPRFDGQNHVAPPPLPLGARLRRVLRDSPLGGGADIWFAPRRVKDIYFLSFEGSPHERYLSLGSKHAIKGDFGSPGWRLLTTLGIRVAAYDAVLGTRSTVVDLARLMPGYEARFGDLTASFFAGPGYARSLTGGILATGRFGRYGASALGEFWFDWKQRLPNFARFTAGYVLIESANRSAAVGLRHGLPVPGVPFYVGPEASWSAGRDVQRAGAGLHSAYRKGRLGLHASEIPLFAARLRVSAGAQWLNGRRPGAYAEMAAYLPY